MIKDIIIHDRTAPGPNTPDHPPALVPLPQNTRQGNGLGRHRAARRPGRRFRRRAVLLRRHAS